MEMPFEECKCTHARPDEHCAAAPACPKRKLPTLHFKQRQPPKKKTIAANRADSLENNTAAIYRYFSRM